MSATKYIWRDIQPFIIVMITMVAGMALLVLHPHIIPKGYLGFALALLLVIAVACLLITWLLLSSKKNRARHYGVELEAAAFRNLQRGLPRGWVAKAGVRSSAWGDIDIVLSKKWSFRSSFAIEIKAWHGVVYRNGRLLKANGQPVYGKPLEQARRNATAINGVAVLWLPNAKKQNTGTAEGVIVINGDAVWLCHVLIGLGS